MLTDPAKWMLPSPERVLNHFKGLGEARGAGKQTGSDWNFSPAISPLDLYAYLKLRFGPPNGPAMLLRSPSVDNLIHWNYTLECPQTFIDIFGLNTRTEIRAHSIECDARGWQMLEENLVGEFKQKRRELAQVQDTFERWHLFLNPYRRLDIIATRIAQRLQELNIPHLGTMTFPITKAQASEYRERLANALTISQEVMSLSVCLTIIAPIMGEAALNVIVMFLAKTDIRNDQRLRENFSRSPIDVRIKTLHLHCDGVAAAKGSEEPVREFLKLMNRRNDALHGNVDPRRTSGEEVYFDFHTIPLLKTQRSFAEVALANVLQSLNPEDALKDLQVTREFVSFLIERLAPEVQDDIRVALREQQLGFRAKTGTIGVILPGVTADIYPVTPMDDPK